MKEYGQKELRAMVFSFLEKLVKENPHKIEIDWVRSNRFPDEKGKVRRVDVHDNDSGEGLTLMYPNPKVLYCTDEGFRKLEEVISELKTLECHRINAYMRVLKVLDEKTLITKLFDKLFLAKLKYPLHDTFELKPFLFTIYDRSFEASFTLYELSRKEALVALS